MEKRTEQAARWMGTGYSDSPDAAAAGTAAATQAIAGRSPALLIVYCAVRYDFARLLDAVRAQADAGTVIVGCTTAGHLTPGYGDVASESVVIVAMGGPGLEVRASVARNASASRQEAGAVAAAGVAELTKEHRAGLLLCDGLLGEQDEVVRGAYSVATAMVPLVGGCAGDDMRLTLTHLFFGDRDGVEVLTDAVVGVALGSDAKLGVGIAHGWHKRGEPMIVTRSEKGRLYELDGAPALDVFLERTGIDPAVLENAGAFEAAAFAKPLGLSRRTGEDIRIAHSWDPEDRSLLFLADTPQGALAWVMGAEEGSIADAGAVSCRQAVDALDGADPVGFLAFDCGIRKAVLGPDGVEREIAAIERETGGAPLAGFYSYGEFARTRGARGLHRLTVVTLAIA
ncbi:FIST signal transduction protein [Actinoplanes sp. DH11]|uniref:FIST signal transduction protein n=1 Tax=Actinoplanes sp. DH11 TaxID=2857011 RepID=UPI001E38A41A|nr:FIST N-terminal domain-containing protein [Actinoplanes sp. DH11]